MNDLKNKLLSIDIFEDNKFLDKYCELICKNFNTRKECGVTEQHHIIPRLYFLANNLRVDNSENNLINLTCKDHILAHYYLCLFVKDELMLSKVIYAFMMMANTRKLPDTEQDMLQQLDAYDNIKRDWINHLQNKMIGNQRAKGNILTEETRRQMSKSRMGHATTPSTKCKISNAHKNKKCIYKDGKYLYVNQEQLNEYLMNGWELRGKPVSQEHKDAISRKNKGAKRSEEARKKMSIAAIGREPWNKGVPQSQEAKIKNSNAHQGRLWINNGVVEKMILPNDLQYHLDNNWQPGRIKFKTKQRIDGGDNNE